MFRPIFSYWCSAKAKSMNLAHVVRIRTTWTRQQRNNARWRLQCCLLMLCSNKKVFFSHNKCFLDVVFLFEIDKDIHDNRSSVVVFHSMKICRDGRMADLSLFCRNLKCIIPILGICGCFKANSLINSVQNVQSLRIT